MNRNRDISQIFKYRQTNAFFRLYMIFNIYLKQTHIKPGDHSIVNLTEQTHFEVKLL